jgi:hypothetical protein
MQRLVALVVGPMLILSAFAADRSTVAFADATSIDSGGTISVGVSTDSSSGGSPGAAAATVSAPSTASNSSAPSSATICTSTVLTLNNQLGPPPGVTTPGSWYSITCSGPTSSTTQNLWISAGTPAPPAPTVDPRTVALQAENELHLPSPVVSFNPANAAVVNLPTWLWVNPAIWHPYSITATVGGVAATATASPVSVTWSMGDGDSVGCGGPGSVYQPELPSSAQTTNCSYVYPMSSAGQASPNGSSDQSAFTVTATVAWQVSWTVQGATGGGVLPGLDTTARASLPVMQVESVNS